ncbi:MAG: helicase HerA-like domain-containing protein [Kineosporiaceae bacterium]
MGDDRSTAERDAITAAVREGYGFDDPAIELGALVPGPGAPTEASVRVRLPLAMLNRHGLIAGATGTGKTRTVQLIAEQLSDHGVPVVLADLKGDLSGLVRPGEPGDKLLARATEVGQEWSPASYPAEFLSLGGIGPGVPVRSTVTAFGPVLLAKVLDLNETQASSLRLVFHFADKAGLPLLDLADLRAVLHHLVSDEGKAELEELGALSKATAGVILRELIGFTDDGAEAFFGEPEFDTADLLRTADDGRGVVTCVELAEVLDKPRLFSTFLLWLLADLFQELPEVGDLDKPKLVFVIEEAHLLFTGASPVFLEQVTQIVRLIRSKGVGILFVTQSPKDVHPDVLAQLGSRVQHALRAHTPDDAKALRAAVSTYPVSGYDLEEVLTGLGTGEAVVTGVSPKGTPTPVAWAKLPAPRSLMAPAGDALAATVAASPLAPRYQEVADRESARELLAARLAAAPAEPGEVTPGGQAPPEGPAGTPERPRSRRDAHDEEGVVEKVVTSSAFRSFLRSAGTVLGREITRSVLGTAKRSRRR